MQKSSGSINLLKKQSNLTDRFIIWALTIGRLLVILIEIIALSAFIYRFFLDRELINQHSEIVRDQEIVSYLKDSEKTYRNLQDRLTVATKYSTLGTNRLKVFSDIVGFTPKGMSFNGLSLYENRITIDANVDSVSSLGTFVNSIKNYPAIDTVSIDKIGSKPSSAVITLNMTATLKPNLIYEDTNK